MSSGRRAKRLRQMSIEQDMDAVMQRLEERPDDIVGTFGQSAGFSKDGMSIGPVTRSFLESLPAKQVKHWLRKGWLTVREPFTTKDGVRFIA